MTPEISQPMNSPDVRPAVPAAPPAASDISVTGGRRGGPKRAMSTRAANIRAETERMTNV
jgi:hypothetical protein